jgi:hypothetical protein
MSGFSGGIVSNIRVIAASAVAVSHTGTTAKTAVVTIPLPAIGPNDQIRYQVAYSSVNSANNKTYAVTLNGVGGTDYFASTLTTNHILETGQKRICNRGATNSQHGGLSAANIVGAASASAAVTSAIETNVSVNLCICITLANSGETAKVESYLVELITQ